MYCPAEHGYQYCVWPDSARLSLSLCTMASVAVGEVTAAEAEAEVDARRRRVPKGFETHRAKMPMPSCTWFASHTITSAHTLLVMKTTRPTETVHGLGAAASYWLMLHTRRRTRRRPPRA